MLPSERYHFILMELESKGIVAIAELENMLNVSTDTVRRDLVHLERLNKLQRVHGGAVSKEDVVTNQAFAKREVKFIDRKKEIASVAAGFVKERGAISLNAGTTNIELAKYLSSGFEQLTVITNSLKVAEVLSGKKGFTVILPGGILNHDEFSLYGSSTGDEIARFNIDTAFISVNAISLEKGLTDFRLGEAEVINAMIRNAGQAVVVADSSKFETVSYLNICGLDRVRAIVTDSELNEELKRKYEDKKVNIVCKGISLLPSEA